MQIEITKVGGDTRFHPALKLGDIVTVDEIVSEEGYEDRNIAQESQDNNTVLMDLDFSTCIQGSWIYEHHQHEPLIHYNAMMYRIVEEQ